MSTLDERKAKLTEEEAYKDHIHHTKINTLCGGGPCVSQYACLARKITSISLVCERTTLLFVAYGL